MKNETYEEFVEKFKPKKTTDDCYTPTIVYDAISSWVANEYNVDESTFLRPFYPGGDFENYNYKNGIVVDNPPFSILSKIIKFYIDKNIKFFLFAPTLTSCRYGDYCTIIATGVAITYENGACVNTSFVTNLEPHEIRIKTSPSLYDCIFEANKQNLKNIKKSFPKYIYPNEVITVAQICPFSAHGIKFEIPRFESVRISSLESQRKKKKGIFGCGWLISERVQAERVQAEREKAEREKAERVQAEREKVERWELNDQEKEIVKKLSKHMAGD